MPQDGRCRAEAVKGLQTEDRVEGSMLHWYAAADVSIERSDKVQHACVGGGLPSLLGADPEVHRDHRRTVAVGEEDRRLATPAPEVENGRPGLWHQMVGHLAREQ